MPDPAFRLLAALSARGLAVRADGGRLVVRPAGVLTAGERAALVEHRAAVLKLLAMREEWAAVEAGFVWRPAWDVTPTGRVKHG
jgi:hypothetical protein